MKYNLLRWDQTTLGKFISIKRGYDLTSKERRTGNIPVYGAAGHNGYHNEIKAKAPGIIIGRSGGSFGQVHFVTKDFWPHNTSMYVTDFKGNDPDFVYYLLKLLDFSALNSGSAQPSLNRNFLYPIKIRVPKPQEQTLIGTLLKQIDQKIVLNNKINTELEAMAKLIYDYWFVQFDFPDANGKPYKSSGGKMVYNEALNREIPEGWDAVLLGDIIIRSGTGLNPRKHFKLGEGDNYYITIKSIGNGKINFDNRCDRISDESLNIIDARSDLQVGDILFTSIQPIGVTYLIQEKPTNWNINESVFTLRADKKKITPEFLFMLLSSEEMKMFTRQSSTGSIHKGIRHGVLKSFKLPYSGKLIVDQFTKILRPMLKQKYLLDIENQKLSELRDWLLPMLMNGQVTVKDFNIAAEQYSTQ